MAQEPGYFKDATAQEWDKAPPPQPPRKESPWAPLLDKVTAGDIARVPVADMGKLKGLRIGLARLASSRHMKLEFRILDGDLLVRRSEEDYQPPAPKDPATKRPPGRPRKSPQE